MFQKDPQSLMAHPDQGIEKFEDLKKLTLFMSARRASPPISSGSRPNFGFSDAKVKPYTFNPQPFLADKQPRHAGLCDLGALRDREAGGFKPKIFLLADQGFDSYSTLIETRRELVEKRPDLVQRFVDASIIGWYNYLYGDNSRGQRADQAAQPGNDRRSDRLFASPR